MSDHVDGDTPAPARDAAGGRLTDEQAAALARWLTMPRDTDPLDWTPDEYAGARLVASLWGDGWVPDGDELPAPEMATDDALAELWGHLARVVLAWRPVVAAARGLADALAAMWEADPTRRPDGGPAVDLEAAVRALGGDA